MKSKFFKNILRIIPMFLAMFSGLLLFTYKPVSAAPLNTLPDYFSIDLANYTPATPEVYTPLKRTFTNGDAFFVDGKQAVVLTFDTEKLKMTSGQNTSYRISQISATISFNNNVISTDLTKNEGFDKLAETTEDSEYHIYTLRINPSLASSFEYYGKYSISFSYNYLNSIYSYETISFTCNFYIFSASDYTSDGAKKFTDGTQNGTNSSIYSYNYTQDEMFSLVYDRTKFNLNITRLYQQLSTTTTITYKNENESTVANYNELGQTTSIEYVFVDTIYETDSTGANIPSKKNRVTFNNIGTYYITYQTIFNGGEVFSQYNLSSDETSKLLNNTVYIYGVQAYYTGENGLEEFKQTAENDHSKITQQADITSKVEIDNNTINNFSEIQGLTPVKTNQAPVYFLTNATSSTSTTSTTPTATTTPTTKYFYFKDLSEFTSAATLPDGDDYTNSPLSQSGVYLVQFAYTFAKISSQTTHYQFFLFEITTTSPNLTIQEITYDKDKNEIRSDVPTNYVTCNNVVINKNTQEGTFDSKATVKVFIAESFNTNDFTENNSQIVSDSATFDKSAKYKVEVSYGRSGQKKYISYFTIDKTGVNGIQIHSATKITNTTYKKESTNLLNNNQQALFVNGSIAISWNNKEDNGYAKTYAEYKYFPTSYSATFANSLDSSAIQSFYESDITKYGIPSTDIFSFGEGTLPVSTYSNTEKTSGSLNETQILSASGLYIIKIYDETALISETPNENSKYLVVFIDNTETNIITVKDGKWSFVKDAKTTSEDYTLYFGKDKLIKFYSTSDDQLDPWLKKYFIDSEELSNKYITRYKTDFYLKIEIKNPVYYTENANGETLQNFYLLTQSGKYGLKLSAKDKNDVPIESQFIFYVGCSSNLNYTQSTFNKNYNASHMVTFSTDNSKMTLSYTTAEGTKSNLLQADVITSSDNSKKTNYYHPTAKDTLYDEILDFSYCTEPSEILSVKSIKMDYYAFEKGDKGTYKFGTNPTSFLEIYNKTGIQLGSAVSNELNTYSWELNVENNQSKRKTRAGKYVITREYVSTTDKYDPIQRELVFIVDRNGIISTPETNSNGELVYYTGGAIRLQVANNSDLFFYDIYYATQMSQTAEVHIPVLTTNLLPVTVYIPTYKYGYDENGTFTPEESIVKYYEIENKDGTKTNKYFKNYELSAYVEKYEDAAKTKNPLSRTELVGTTKGYLTLDKSTSLPEFIEQGYYKVVIESGAGDNFEFVFQIKYEEPNYSLLDTNNSELKESNNFFYTNKDTVRISWQDSASKYWAKIDPTKITYNVNNVNGTIDVKNIFTNGTSHYVDLKLSDIGAYKNGTQVEITLQYIGNIDPQYSSKTSTVIIDTQAPLTNITNLVNQTGLSFKDLRNSENSKYNTSQSTGLFANYAFVVDVSDYSFLKTPTDTNNDFYKVYYRIFENNGKNTKYVIGNVQESDITLNDFSSVSKNIIGFSSTGDDFQKVLEDNIGKYIEFVEEDYAGNRTVYTIFVSNFNEQETFLTYKKTSQNQSPENVKYTDLSNGTTLDIYSKYELNLTDINLLHNTTSIGKDNFYQIISINKVVYVKTPYSGEQYYKMSEYVDSSSTLYTLGDISKLSSSSFIQPIVLYSVPKYQQVTINAHVINQMLEHSTLAKFYGDEKREGIVIKLPNESADTNKLFCSTLEVSGKIIINIDNALNNNCFESEATFSNFKNYKISYINSVNGSKYFCLEIINNLQNNNHYIYTIIDNYGDKIVVPHIYGQAEIKEPIISESGYITSYDAQGDFIYYSSSNITYRFNSIIYPETTVVVSVGTNTSEYKLTVTSGSTLKVTDKDNKEVQPTEYNNYFTCTIGNSILSLTMKAAPINFSSGLLGNKYLFTVTQTLNNDFVGSSIQDKIETNFATFNKVPEITLLGDNDDVTSILGNNQIYTKQVTISSENTILDFPYEIYIITPKEEVFALNYSFTANENGTYKIVINYLGDLSGLEKVLEFTLKNSEEFKYQVMKINADGFNNLEIKETGNPFTYTKYENGTNITITEQKHYILNGDFVIETNESKNLTYDFIEIVNTYTAIYLIHTDYSKANSSTEFFSERIAITKIPETNSLFNEKGFVKYETDGSSTDLTKKTSDTITVYTEDGFNKGRKISWTNYYLIPENKITATIFYGEVGKSQFQQKVVESNNMSYITLKTSGVYLFKFEDLAGNVHLFGNYSDTEYFSMQYLSSVIFNVNNDSPINYAIYDSSVDVVIPQSTLSIYDQNAYPVINVELNGNKIEVATTTKYSWTFTQAGLYKIWFTAKIDGENIFESPIFFTILSSEESRKSYSFNSYNNSYVEDIILNGKSILAKLANENVGTLYLNKYLKDLTIHLLDVKTGPGTYTIVVNANNDFNQKYSFSIWINNKTVPIVLSHENGTTTNQNITVSFSTSNVINQVGDCVLKITGRDNIYITNEALENGEINELNEIVLSKTNLYYIEVTTLSGQLLYSSYINKVEPLNTVSIILIVAGSIVVIVGAVVFILMRRRMKIK